MIIYSFTGPRQTGNCHWVEWNSKTNHNQSQSPALPLLPLSATASSCNPPIEVLISSNTGNHNIVCRQNGHNIQFCGSGILAAGHFLKHQGAAALPLKMHRRKLALKTRAKKLGFSTKTEVFKPIKNSALWLNIVGKSIEAGAFIGCNTDYAIIELKNARSVLNTRPKLHLLKKLTRRALIVTAKSGKRSYVMRYFAPQYGVNEDTATGSANTFLIQYWARKLNASILQGKQLSKQGAVFWGTYAPPVVTLYGNTQKGLRNSTELSLVHAQTKQINNENNP